MFWEIIMSIHLKVIFTYSGGSPSAHHYGDIMMIMGGWELLSEVNQHPSVWVGNSQILPVSHHLRYMVSSTFELCLEFFFFFFLYHWHAEHAQGLQLTLPSPRHKDITFYFDACSGRQGAFPVQEGAKEYPEWEKQQETACDVRTLQHSINDCGFGRVNCVGVWDL